MLIPRSLGGSSGTFLGLADTPSSYVGQALKAARVNAGATALEFYTPTDSLFAWAADWVNVITYGAAGVVTTTTLAATLNAGSTSATLTSASSFAIGHGMAIPGAGAAGAELVVELTNVVGNVVSWSGATSTLVSAGQTIHHDDTQALLDALAMLKNVYVPVGYYNTQGGQLNNVIQMTNIGQRIQGGMSDMRQRTQSGPVIGSVIYSRSLTKDCIQMVANNTQVMDLTIAVDATVSTSKTAGAGLVIGDSTRSGLGPSLGPCFGAVIERVGISHHWDGMRVEYSSGCFIDKLYVTAPHRYGLYGTSVEPTGGNWFQNIQCYPLGYYGGTVQAGIYLDRMDTTRWVNINCIGFPKNFWLKSAAGNINQQVFTGFTNENNTGNYGITLEKGAYNHVRCKFVGGELLASAIYVGAGVEDATFEGITLALNTATSLIYGTRTKIIGIDSYGGITVHSGANGTQIIGSSITTTGLTVNDGATNNVIQGNYMNTSSISMTARGTSRIQGNIGMVDYGDSIASTPGYVGQEALSGGQFYKAVGTSSSADWKQITV